MNSWYRRLGVMSLVALGLSVGESQAAAGTKESKDSVPVKNEVQSKADVDGEVDGGCLLVVDEKGSSSLFCEAEAGPVDPAASESGSPSAPTPTSKPQVTPPAGLMAWEEADSEDGSMIKEDAGDETRIDKEFVAQIESGDKLPSASGDEDEDEDEDEDDTAMRGFIEEERPVFVEEAPYGEAFYDEFAAAEMTEETDESQEVDEEGSQELAIDQGGSSNARPMVEVEVEEEELPLEEDDGQGPWAIASAPTLEGQDTECNLVFDESGEALVCDDTKVEVESLAAVGSPSTTVAPVMPAKPMLGDDQVNRSQPAGETVSAPEASKSAPAASSTPESTQEGFKRFVNEDKGYSIQFPSNWEVRKGMMGLDVFALSPMTGQEDSFRENVNVLSEKLPQKVDLDGYYKASLDALKQEIPGFSLISSSPVEIDGMKGYRIEFTHGSGQGDVDAIVIQYILVDQGQKVTLITGAIEADKLPDYKPLIDKVAASLDYEGN